MSSANVVPTDGGTIKGDPEADGTLAVFAEPDIAGYVDELLGPDAGLQLGVKATATKPCPGAVKLAAYAEVTVGGEINLFVTKLSYEAPAIEAELPILEEPFFGCAKLAITTTSLPDDAVNTPYPAAKLDANGGKSPYVWTATGLPPGLRLADDGTLGGTPSTAGAYDTKFAVADSSGDTATATITIVINATLSVATTRLPDAQVGSGYDTALAAAGGSGTLTWKATKGALPSGLTLKTDGEIVGQATDSGNANVTITVTDESGATASASFTLTVDKALPAPVSAGTPPAPQPVPACAGACATTWGDPHLVTYDGTHFDFQQTGEFILTKSSATDLQIQVRQQPYNGSRTIAVNTAVAFLVAAHRVAVYLDGSAMRTLVDGTAITPSTAQQPLPDGGSLTGDAGNARVTIRWPDGSLVVVDTNGGAYLTLSLNLTAAQESHLSGLLGDADGSATNDLVTRTGTVLPYPPTNDRLYGDFAASWRIAQNESLFDYTAGQSTATYTDTAFPYATATSADLPMANRDAALATCRTAGIADGPILDACVLDVAETGNISAATAALQAQTTVTNGLIAGSAPGDAWTDPTNATGTAALSYGHVGCPALDAKQQCTSGTWLVMPQAPWIWTAQFTTPGQHVATFTKTVQISAAQAAVPLSLSVLSDDDFTASVDGAQVSSAGFDQLTTTSLNLTPGAHVLRFTVINRDDDDPQNNPAGIAWKLTTT